MYVDLCTSAFHQHKRPQHQPPPSHLPIPSPFSPPNKKQQFCSITGDEQICLLSPYPASNSIQTRRASARRIGSTYAYDFLGLMEVSLIQKWDKHLKDLASAFPARTDDKIPEQVRCGRFLGFGRRWGSVLCCVCLIKKTLGLRVGLCVCVFWGGGRDDDDR